MGLWSAANKLTAIDDGDWAVSSAERASTFRLGQTAGLIFLAVMAIVLPLGPMRFGVAATIASVAGLSWLFGRTVPDKNLDGAMTWLYTIGALVCAALLPIAASLAALTIVGSLSGFAIFQGRRMYLVLFISALWLGAVGYLSDTPRWYLVPITMIGLSSGMIEFGDWFRLRSELQRRRMELLTEVGGTFTWEYNVDADLFLQSNGPTQSLLGKSNLELTNFLNEQARTERSLAKLPREGQTRKLVHTDGSDRWFKMKQESRVRADGATIIYGVAVDVTELELGRRREQQRAEVDSLTGLANRNGLAHFLDNQTDLAGRAILVLDLDRFKEVNDTLGHLIGDQLITAAAHRLKTLSSDRCFLARLGGDEFSFALVGDRADEVDNQAESLAKKICEVMVERFAVGGFDLTTAASVGIASGADLDWSELLRRADGAMYEAKKVGGRYRWYSQNLDNGSGVRLKRRTHLNRNLEDEIVLHFQPLVDATDHQTVAVEALARWEHPTEGLLFPDAFLPLMEQSGLSARFDRQVMRLAVQSAVTLAQVPSKSIQVSFNVNPRSLWSPLFLGDLKNLLEENPMAQGQLGIEVTERGLLDEPDRLNPILRSLADLDVELSLDDFGTGVSSLIRLRSLPFDVVKIDRSFVAGILDNHTDSVIVQSTIKLATDLGKQTVAEGVETLEQADALAAMGCTMLQGWAFSRSVPLDKLLQQRSEIPI